MIGKGIERWRGRNRNGPSCSDPFSEWLAQFFPDFARGALDALLVPFLRPMHDVEVLVCPKAGKDDSGRAFDAGVNFFGAVAAGELVIDTARYSRGDKAQMVVEASSKGYASDDIKKALKALEGVRTGSTQHPHGH